MAANNNQKNGSAQTQQNAAEKSGLTRVRENKPLVGILVLIGLIALVAIGVGVYYAIDNARDNDEDEAEVVANDQDGSSEEEQDSEENSEEGSTEENSESAEAQDPATAEEGEEGSTTEEATTEEETAEEENTDSEDSNESEDGQEDLINEEESDSGDSEETEENGEETEENSEEGSENESEEENSEESAEITTSTSTGHSLTGLDKSMANQANILASGLWTATNYDSGDIVEESYTVQLGDTLWEISGGFYGDEFQWSTILGLNASAIGFLSDGQQALIIPGQNLTLR